MTGAEDFILRAGAVAVALTAIITFVTLIVRRLVVRPLAQTVRAEITKGTKPIQENANGGWSLPDAIRILHEMRDDVASVKHEQSVIGQRQARIEGALDAHMALHKAA